LSFLPSGLSRYNARGPTKEIAMDLGLRGRNAVVLGGTRGIGRAIAGTLAGEGASVAVCARNTDQVKSAVAELQTQGVRATGAPVDITDAAALKSWIAGVAKELGSIAVFQCRRHGARWRSRVVGAELSA
jgi:3-oxoacyl-[acyl-carrier protein] reductase